VTAGADVEADISSGDFARMVSPGDVDNFYGDTLRDLTRFGRRIGDNLEKTEATDDEVDEVDDAEGDIMQISW
jgi:hypothetical protein